MIPSLKRQRHREDDIEDSSSSKKPQRQDVGPTVSESQSSLHRSMDLDLPYDDTSNIEDGMTDLRNERICYGAICDSQVLLNSQTERPNTTQPWARYYLFNIVSNGGACYLTTDKEKLKHRSVLDCHTASSLMFTADKVESVSFAAVLGANVFYGKRGKCIKSSAVNATINIYGPRSLMSEVDQALSEIGSYLQHPVFLEPGIPYINPQYLYSSSERTDLRHLIGPTCEDTKSNTSREVEKVMECLDDWSENISETGYSADDLHQVLNQFLLETKLKDHQFQGVKFILSREDGEVTKQIQRKMVMSIHHSLLSHPERPGRGGILADMMGLGKTLTMLSAILCSKHLNKSLFSSDTGRSDGHESQPSNLTLIVLPSRQILDVWKNEINRRFQPQAFKTVTFHGQTRAKRKDYLLDNDIVLTTYHTVEKDNSGRRVLNSIMWSRIVLDEAHQIRNSSIKLHKAAASLQSETRWCLTGTPIQNSFDDLKSLLQFLRFEPFCVNKLFEEYIVKPFRETTDNQSDQSRNLKVMLKACCLRRTQAKLDLPATTIQKIDVIPSEVEKAMFTKILEQCREDFDRMAGKEGSSKKSNILFSAIMKLRRICNHGVIPIEAPTSLKRLTQLAVPKMKQNVSRSPSAEPACDFCNEKNGEDDLFGALDSCPLCSRLLSRTHNELFPATQPPQSLPSSPELSMEIDTPDPWRTMFKDLPFSKEHLEQSSKMSTVVDNINVSCLDGSSKSVVFSSWRDTLDILAAMLSAKGINFVKVDGRNPVTGRTELLSRFCHDPGVRVLLISINTGAVGLTLTEANMVHIIEPQWNPTIEDQAIARVVRMGQTRPVTIFKYITSVSIEQTVVKLQEKKTRIIKLSMQDKDDNESDMNLDNFKFAIDPNEWEAAS